MISIIKKSILGLVVLGLMVPQASFAGVRDTQSSSSSTNQSYYQSQAKSPFNTIVLPKIWENGWVKDGDVVSTNDSYAIASFTVSTEKKIVAKNSMFVIRSNQKQIGKYLTEVELTDSKGNSYPVTLQKNGTAILNQTIVVAPGTHDFFIRAKVSKNIPQNTKIQVVLKNSQIKIGRLTIIPLLYGMSLPLQTVIAKK